ncbi:hypothetical protein [Mycolicibacterium elephantis]
MTAKQPDPRDRVDWDLLMHKLDQAREAGDEQTVAVIRDIAHYATAHLHDRGAAFANLYLGAGIRELEADPDADPRDPIRAAFEDYRKEKAPRDVVEPVRPQPAAEELAPFVGRAVDVTYHEATAAGVERRTERLTVTMPYQGPTKKKGD